MDELIEALTILKKYTSTKYPIHCEHDVMTICDVDPNEVSEKDIKRLDELGFFVSEEYGDKMFQSYAFGSC